MPSAYICSSCRQSLLAAARLRRSHSPRWNKDGTARLSQRRTTHAIAASEDKRKRQNGLKAPIRFLENTLPIPKHLQQIRFEDPAAPRLPDTWFPHDENHREKVFRYKHPVQQAWEKERANLERLILARDTLDIRSDDQANTQSLFEDPDEGNTNLAAHPEIERWTEMWRMADVNARGHQFPSLMVRYMRQKSPFTLTLLLITTSINPLPSDEMVSDVLDLSVLHATVALSGSVYQARMDKLFQMTCLILRRYPPTFPLATRTINNLLAALSPARQRMLIRLCLTREIELDYTALKHGPFADAADFWAMTHTPRSIALVQHMVQTQSFQVNGSSRLTMIMEKCIRSPASLNADALIAMVQLVKKCNFDNFTPLTNIMIKRLMDHGLLREAFLEYEEMTYRGLQKDAMTYAIMLDWSRRAVDFHFYRHLHRLIRSRCNEDPDFVMTERLLANWMLACFAFESHRYDMQYDTILKMYAEHAEMQPLELLGINTKPEGRPDIHRPLQSRRAMPPKAKILPGSQLLGVMIFAWLRAYRYQPNLVLDVYTRFRDLGRERNEWIAPVVRSKFVWDSFLFALTWSEATVHVWSDIFTGMFDPHRINSEMTGIPRALRVHHGRNTIPVDTQEPIRMRVRDVLQRHTRSSKRALPPANHEALVRANQHTWNILMNGFARHNMPEAAQNVMFMILRLNPEPSSCSWNTLIKAYAVAEDREKMKETLEWAESCGHVRDEFTLRSIEGTRGNAGRARELLGSRARGRGVPTMWERNEDGTYNNPYLEEYGHFVRDKDALKTRVKEPVAVA